LNQDPAQVFATLLGDTTGAADLSRVVDAGPETGIADQVLGRWEARDVADGGQDGHRDDEAETWDLDEVGVAAGPGLDGGKAGQFMLDCGKLGFDVL
jgi:hypothetical protein